MKIALDCGHGLKTAGKQTPDGIKEWEINDKVRDKEVAILKDYDVEIIHTDNDEGNVDESLTSRRVMYVNQNADAFVSNHHNALDGKWGKHTGIEVYVDRNATEEDLRLATLIHDKLVKYTGLKGRGVKRADFTIINQNKIPAVLVEGGFMDSEIDYPVITSEKGQEAYARAVAEGLIEFLRLNKKNSTENTTINITTNYTVKINTAVLNVRDGAGTKYKINTTVKKDEVYTIVEESNGWGKLKSGAGWISLAYTVRNDGTTKTVETKSKYVLGLYVVNTESGLNVRKGAGTNYSRVKVYKNGTRFDTYELDGDWARTPSGWVNLDYCKLVRKY